MDRKSLNKLFKHYDREEERAYRKATKAAMTGKGFDSAYVEYRKAAQKNKKVIDKYA